MRGRTGIGKTRTSFVFPLCVSVRISSEALVRNQHQFDVLKAVDTSKKDIQLDFKTYRNIAGIRTPFECKWPGGFGGKALDVLLGGQQWLPISGRPQYC